METPFCGRGVDIRFRLFDATDIDLAITRLEVLRAVMPGACVEQVIDVRHVGDLQAAPEVITSPAPILPDPTPPRPRPPTAGPDP